MNEDIRARIERVIDEEGEQVGVIGRDEALQLARERGLDLVEVSPTTKPPVCRILDFGKYSYEKTKRAKDAKNREKQAAQRQAKKAKKPKR